MSSWLQKATIIERHANRVFIRREYALCGACLSPVVIHARKKRWKIKGEGNGNATWNGLRIASLLLNYSNQRLGCLFREFKMKHIKKEIYADKTFLHFSNNCCFSFSPSTSMPLSLSGWTRSFESMLAIDGNTFLNRKSLSRNFES